MAIVDKLRQILGYKNDIKEALEKKGLEVTDDMSSYSAAIEGLPGGADNLEKLLAGTLTEIHSSTPIKYGRGMFNYNPSLKIADITISNNITQTYQYSAMFYNCPSLTKGPELLPATVLKDRCYNEMFDGCTSLTKAPSLPAKQLAQYCYAYMFQNCTALTEAPDLPATAMKEYAYANMFSGCTSLQKTGIIAITGNITFNAINMFSGCTSLKEMTWTSTTPPTIQNAIWTNCPADMVIYVPDASVSKYKAASQWSSRAAYIKPISEKPTA